MSGAARKGFLAGMLALLALAVAAHAVAAGAVTPPDGCAGVASLSGSDGNAGTLDRPYRTVQTLVDSLAPGEVGCLRGATYVEHVVVERGGEPGAPIVISSYPGEGATLLGRLQINDGADFVTVSSLTLDGRNEQHLPSPSVNGDDVDFIGNDVTTDNTAICFDLGPTTYGRAYDTLIQSNRVHHCGTLPATNLEHGMYVEHATGASILDNLIYANADRGIQLYPDAQETYVGGNVIDGNGVGVLIGGGVEDFGEQASSGNVIEHNLITNSTDRYNVESHWGGALVGTGNVVRRNCIFGGARAGDGQGVAAADGFTTEDNLLADPLYQDRDAADFRLRAGSPCLHLETGMAIGGDDGKAPRGQQDGPPPGLGAAPARAIVQNDQIAAPASASHFIHSVRRRPASSRARHRLRAPRPRLRAPLVRRHRAGRPASCRRCGTGFSLSR